MFKFSNVFLSILGIVTVGNCSFLSSFIKKETVHNNILKSRINNVNHKLNDINVNKSLMMRDSVNLWQHNGATMSAYGPYIYVNKSIRRLRLNIHMTGYSYVYFLAAIKFNKEIFIDKLLGPEITDENPDWMNVQHEINSVLSEYSLSNKLPSIYFYNVLKKWLKSEKGWKSFFGVFTGANLNNNTYNMPEGYDQEMAEEQFRKQGAILQFSFYPPREESRSGNWNLDGLPIIFPNIPQIIGLKQYYRDFWKDSETGEKKLILPIMPIHVPNPDGKKYRSASSCSKNIIQDLTFYLNLSQQLIDDKRVSIDSDSFSRVLYYNSHNTVLIKLDFWYNHGQTLYNRKLVEMYLVS